MYSTPQGLIFQRDVSGNVTVIVKDKRDEIATVAVYTPSQWVSIVAQMSGRGDIVAASHEILAIHQPNLKGESEGDNP